MLIVNLIKSSRQNNIKTTFLMIHLIFATVFQSKRISLCKRNNNLLIINSSKANRSIFYLIKRTLSQNWVMDLNKKFKNPISRKKNEKNTHMLQTNRKHWLFCVKLLFPMKKIKRNNLKNIKITINKSKQAKKV